MLFSSFDGTDRDCFEAGNNFLHGIFVLHEKWSNRTELQFGAGFHF
jgi:hypothetical protein